MKVTLLCALGMSTSMLVERMKKAAKARSVSIQIEAHSVNDLEGQLETSDFILLGPQIRYKQRELSAKAKAVGVPLAVIDMKAYGSMDGDKVLNQALELLR
ncbi:PTS sugar transporter subunit IIB [Virgibacillus sp. AGTR]|uniref:PTS sugar transporter subunit IIB n=1 Tax=Virgibacillus sp. AGTR TaxID=2812055 RepID=UPI001965F7EB|nr:PTS sugar transporter subunit IIB [Virgibacillus sp. AGTR]MCC2249958.1 PTS sugar transporter subunit IIB [Virgibacillus sp. AGTR]QRZ18213.1 PTS sugar transporter subunit IIB [Virgibacillus sp. AGTR]